jgi:hypothetical protein
MQQNDISKLFFDNDVSVELARKLMGQIVKAGAFKPADREAIHFSKWWDRNSEKVGAATLLGSYQGTPAVLKVQFVKPHTPEYVLIREFAKRARGMRIRPPRIFDIQEWGSHGPFEMTVMEIAPEPVIPADKLALDGDIKVFFQAFREYRKVAVKPFVQQPATLARDKVIESFHMWKIIRARLDTQGIISSRYQKVIDEAINYLHEAYGDTTLSFCHGHFSARDVRAVGNEWVLLSNLYWSFRVPLYDLVFGWHWRRLELMGNPSLGEAAISVEQPVWEKGMEKIVGEMGDRDSDVRRLYRLARLERAVAGLNLDLLTLAPELHEQKIQLAALFDKEIHDYCR